MMKSLGVFKIPVVGGVCAGKELGQSWSLSVVTVEVQRARQHLGACHEGVKYVHDLHPCSARRRRGEPEGGGG